LAHATKAVQFLLSVAILFACFMVNAEGPVLLPVWEARPKDLSLSEIDSRVQQIGYPRDKTPSSVARSLVTGLVTDFEKFFAIYRWVTVNIEYDVDAYFSGRVRDAAGSKSAYNRGQAVCDGYADLILEMGRSVGLQVEKVVGYGKGFSYVVGEQPKGTNHAWNAVMLDGKWYLSDATWDAGSVDRKTRKFVKNTKQLKYFLADPDLFLTSHFPKDQRWQLLKNPIDFSTFLGLAKIRPDIGFWDIDVSQYRQNEIHSKSTPLVFNFGAKSPQLSAVLLKDGKKLDGVWAISVGTESDRRLYVSAPQAGSYDLQVYARRNANDSVSQLILEYKLKFDQVDQFTQGFPEQFRRYFDNNVIISMPLQGVLAQRQAAKFQVSVEGASEVILIQDGKKLLTLSRIGEDFVGEVTPTIGELLLSAKFGSDTKYLGLLRYKIE